MLHYDQEDIVNVEVLEPMSASVSWRGLVQRVTGYEGRLVFDSSKPDGTPRKLLDVSRLTALGWRARIGLEEGITSTYQWLLAHERGRRNYGPVPARSQPQDNSFPFESIHFPTLDRALTDPTCHPEGRKASL